MSSQWKKGCGSVCVCVRVSCPRECVYAGGSVCETYYIINNRFLFFFFVNYTIPGIEYYNMKSESFT